MATYEEIIGNLKKRKYAPVYLLMGEEPFYIDQISDFIEKNVMDEADRDFNQVLFYGKDTEAAEILANAKEFPFGSEHRVVIVKEAKEVKDLDLLKSYVENPSPSTILVICYKYAKLRAAQSKVYEKNGVVFVSDKIKDNKLPAWVNEQAKLHNFTLSPQAANIISEHIGNDLSRIDNEFLKLKIILPENSEITPEIIEKNIGISKEYNIFELQNALGERNTQKVYKITYNFCSNLKQNPNVKTISVLYTFYYKLLAYHLAPDKNKETLTRIFGNAHPYVLELNCKYAQRYSLHELKKIIAVLREFDMKSKGVDTVCSEEELLKELIYKILH